MEIMLHNAQNVKTNAPAIVIVVPLNVAQTTAAIGKLEYAARLLTLHLRMPITILVANQVVLYLRILLQFKYTHFMKRVCVVFEITIYFELGQYIQHVGCAVPGNDLFTYEQKSALECKGLCDTNVNCLAINYVTDRDDGSGTWYQIGTCILKRSGAYTDHSDIDGYKNIDCYVKQGIIYEIKNRL